MSLAYPFQAYDRKKAQARQDPARKHDRDKRQDDEATEKQDQHKRGQTR